MKKIYANWHFHNIIGHPVMGLLVIANIVLKSKRVASLADWVHYVTLPDD